MAQMVPLGFLPTCHAQRNPRYPYVSQNGRTVTRGVFEAHANRRARQLQALGINADDFVAMLMPNCIEFFETTFALWKIGATPVPLSQSATKAEMAAYLDLVRPCAVIGDAGIGYDGIKIPANLALDESISPDILPECTARYWRISVTGGSTGRPN
jgi:bile acid-coenzyme A ligase